WTGPKKLQAPDVSGILTEVSSGFASRVRPRSLTARSRIDGSAGSPAIAGWATSATARRAARARERSHRGVVLMVPPQTPDRALLFDAAPGPGVRQLGAGPPERVGSSEWIRNGWAAPERRLRRSNPFSGDTRRGPRRPPSIP